MSDMKRVKYLDYLRIIATFGVIVLHSSGYFYGSEMGSLEWNVYNFYNGLSRFAVPIFIMVSGALFLNGNYSIPKIYKKYIMHIIVTYLLWSFLYAIIFYEGGGVWEIMKKTISGHYHLWFLRMIVGLYISIPILKVMVCKKEALLYFLIFSFAFAFLYPQLKIMVGNFGSPFFNNIISFSNGLLSDVELNVFGGGVYRVFCLRLFFI